MVQNARLQPFFSFLFINSLSLSLFRVLPPVPARFLGLDQDPLSPSVSLFFARSCVCESFFTELREFGGGCDVVLWNDLFIYLRREDGVRWRMLWCVVESCPCATGFGFVATPTTEYWM